MQQSQGGLYAKAKPPALPGAVRSGLRWIPGHHGTFSDPANPRTQPTPAARHCASRGRSRWGSIRPLDAPGHRRAPEGGARAGHPRCVRVFSITGASRCTAMELSRPSTARTQWRQVAASLSTGPRQEADFRCATSADQGRLSAPSAYWASRSQGVTLVCSNISPRRTCEWQVSSEESGSPFGSARQVAAARRRLLHDIPPRASTGWAGCPNRPVATKMCV